MTTPDAASILEKMKDCDRDHAKWQEEINTWQREHARAIEILNQATNFIRMHDADLEEHGAAMVEHIAMLEKFRTALENGEPVPPMTAEQEQLAATHAEAKLRHNRYRGRHKGLIDEVARLEVMLHKVSHHPAP